MLDLLNRVGAKHYIKRDLQPYLPPGYPNPMCIPQHHGDAAMRAARMSAQPQRKHVRVDTVAAFTARCEARALLWRCCDLDLHEAVDKLQHDAERDGLVERIGQDAVQAILAKAFEAVR